MYALADCDNFFVSCERVFEPSLRLKPVLVLSNNDGCVIARSNEVKALGIKMGSPYFQIKDIVDRYNIRIFSSNFILYGDMSNRIIMTLHKFCNSVEKYSIDEAFLNLKDLNILDYNEFAQSIHKQCKKNVGLPISVGIAKTKTLAKLASRLCKYYPALNGSCVLKKTENIKTVLTKTKIEDIWGIGRKHTMMLHSFGIYSAYDFYIKDPTWIKKRMGITGLSTQNELKGIECIAFETSPAAKQQISVTRTFAAEIDNLEDLKEQTSLYVDKACSKLRAQHSLCTQVMVFILTNPFKQNTPCLYDAKKILFPVPTNSSLEINKNVADTVKEMFRPGVRYKRAGISLSHFVNDKNIQLDLFDKIDRNKHTNLMKTIDEINIKTGKNAIGIASESLKGFKMNRNHLSKHFTTDWNDIIELHC
ncbi:MAG: Y-family DNA polymerase [Bacteroidales bacterium]